MPGFARDANAREWCLQPESRLAIGVAIKAAEVGHRVLFLILVRLMGKLKRARQENRLERHLQYLTYPNALVLNETGYLSLSRRHASLLFRLLA